ncbi:carboxypeptidase-like regulatory domain-containing protein [Dawidia soli]|uniref:Carboxypeptidase-like regulatory domain-containing protein n=1 Tax=Dawidia soli TaxID=2782352 RepID=A0AAP2D7E4_9BACT|nr:carboxypeptidase-like regulatory domain-containing protein [Dawidia soli]MBT1686634.1 carboxypeptidase-like regulatory domain-containing protein [Dawidia soli]
MDLKTLLISLAGCLAGLGASGQGTARMFRGVILEDGAKAPVPYAHVYVKRHATHLFHGTVSDLQGAFALSLPTESIGDTLHISSIGYDPRAIVLTPRGFAEHEPIFLTPQTTALPPVVIRDLSAGEFFKRSISHFQKNYLDISFLNTACYWQSTAENDVYQSLLEQNLVIRENNFGKDVKRVIYEDNTVATPRYYHYFDSVESILYFDLIRSTSGVMNPAVTDEWNFSYNYDAKRAEHYVGISGVRKDKLAEVNILINDRSNAVEAVDFRYSWGQNQHSLSDTLLYRFTMYMAKFCITKI